MDGVQHGVYDPILIVLGVLRVPLQLRVALNVHVMCVHGVALFVERVGPIFVIGVWCGGMMIMNNYINAPVFVVNIRGNQRTWKLD